MTALCDPPKLLPRLPSEIMGAVDAHELCRQCINAHNTQNYYIIDLIRHAFIINYKSTYVK